MALLFSHLFPILASAKQGYDMVSTISAKSRPAHLALKDIQETSEQEWLKVVFYLKFMEQVSIVILATFFKTC